MTMKKGLIILLGGMALIAPLIVTLIGQRPISKLNQIAKELATDSIFIGQYPEVYDAADLSGELKTLATTQALLAQSNSDSIQLILNVNDSSIHLVIKGVMIHSSKINIQSVDPTLYKLTNREYLWLLGKPQPISQLRTTIVKEPIVVREAPKDTLEAALNAYKPDTLIQNPAMLHFTIQPGIVIKMVQTENFTDWEKNIVEEFESTFPAPTLLEKYQSIFSKDELPYIPYIAITLPRDDLRAIYRALPTNANLVLVL